MAQYDPTNPFAVPPPAATAKREDAISGQMQSLSIGGIAGRGMTESRYHFCNSKSAPKPQ
jgi:hypothetical protein